MLTAKTHLLTWSLLSAFALVAWGQAPPPKTGTLPMKPADEPGKPGEIKISDAKPVVVKTIPEAGSEGVDPAIKEVRVTFSKKMEDGTWSWASDTGSGADLTGAGKPAYDKDGKTCVLPVKLAPNTTYAVWLNVGKFMNFQDTAGNTAVPYLLVFRTGPAKGK